MPRAQDNASPAVAKQPVPLPAARIHPPDCTITGRAALQAAAARLRLADGVRQTWLAAWGTWDVLRTQHCRRDGILCVGGRPATTASLAAAVGASRTTLYAHLRLLLTAGLIERTSRRWWRLTGLAELEATRNADGRAIAHLHTWRPAHAQAIARLRAADPSGRVWRSVWGAIVLIRHRAQWDTGEPPRSSAQRLGDHLPPEPRERGTLNYVRAVGADPSLTRRVTCDYGCELRPRPEKARRGSRLGSQAVQVTVLLE